MAPFPADEEARLLELKRLSVLDTKAELVYDEITQRAAKLCSTRTALISLVDRDRQWFKSRFGLQARETPREFAFCAHAILKDAPFIVEDACADARFMTNPLVTEKPKIRFYAGAQLVTLSGFALGTLCVIDDKPRQLTKLQVEHLQFLAREVVYMLEMRKST